MNRDKLKIGDVVQVIPEWSVPSDCLYMVLDIRFDSVTLEPLGIDLAATAIRISTVARHMVEHVTAGYVDECLKRASKGRYGDGRIS